jgi:hypothetical protein
MLEELLGIPGGRRPERPSPAPDPFLDYLLSP